MHLEKGPGICAEGGRSPIWEVAVVSSPQRGVNTFVWFGSVRLGSVAEMTAARPSRGSHRSAGWEVKHKQHRTGDRKWVVTEKRKVKKNKEIQGKRPNTISQPLVQVLNFKTNWLPSRNCEISPSHYLWVWCLHVALFEAAASRRLFLCWRWRGIFLLLNHFSF